MTIDTNIFKTRLLDEKKDLETSLAGTGLPDPENPGEWQAAPGDRVDIDSRDEIADRLEDFQEQEATGANLEKRLKDVTLALEKLEAGTYGICEVGGEEIELERLEANPAARTCKTHIEEEDALV